ncbi:MAG: helix-turn-helix domain-containing protein [Candidatus Latescibacteria bacterium]|nr:helix-turn-helix domain-containing protein [Candidatus Latescibacterota bacterium]
MASLHIELRENRERKGLTLETLQAATRINPDFLVAIERGDFDFLPKTYIRLFLRTYATHVGMDPQYVLDRYEELVRPVPEEMEAPPVEEKRHPLSWRVVIALAAGLVLLGLIGVFLFKGRMGDMSPEGPRGFSSSPADSPGQASVEGPSGGHRDSTAEGAPKATVPDTVSPPAAVDREARDTTSVHSIPVEGLGQDSVMVLEGVGVEETWLDVSADSQRAYRGMIKPGDERKWVARERFFIVAGRSSGVQFSFQGNPLPRSKGWASEILRMSITRAGVVVERKPRSSSEPADTATPRPASTDTAHRGR